MYQIASFVHDAKVVARPPTEHPRSSLPDFGSNRPAKSLSSLHHLCLTSRDFVPWRFLDAGQPSVPSVLRDELKDNPFLLAPDVGTFADLRARKDRF